MIALGVDSGSLSTGYGIVEGHANRLRALDYGAIRNPADREHPERLALIHKRIREVIALHRPEVLALEQVFVARNAQSALKLGQVRGAVMVAGIEEGLRIIEFSATQVKAAVTGFGRAEKTQVQFMVKTILGLEKIPHPHDAADALALAICALSRSSWNDRVKAP
jgi:crossover junction endodeoxyribonuclease RuvC